MLRRAIGLVALLAATVLAGASSGRTAAPDTTTLLARYEPVLHLYRADWKPSAVEPFLAAADLERLTAGNWRLVRRSPPASALANGSSQLRLDTRGCTPAFDPDSCYPRRAVTPTVYGRAWVNPTASAGIATVLEYWLFYPSTTGATRPRSPASGTCTRATGKRYRSRWTPPVTPVSVAASQHDLGVTRPWARARRVRDAPGRLRGSRLACELPVARLPGSLGRPARDRATVLGASAHGAGLHEHADVRRACRRRRRPASDSSTSRAAARPGSRSRATGATGPTSSSAREGLSPI